MYYTIQDNGILIAENEQALTRFYENVLPLPSDYEQGKYIIVDGELVLNPDWEEESLAKAKREKYQEANEGAKQYLNGDALYEFEEGKHIEATDGNIAKFTAYALAYITGQLQPTDTVVWNTKEDETVELNQEKVVSILNGLGQVQAYVWAVKFPYYIGLIEQAETVEEVNAIVIDYTSEVQ